MMRERSGVMTHGEHCPEGGALPTEAHVGHIVSYGIPIDSKYVPCNAREMLEMLIVRFFIHRATHIVSRAHDAEKVSLIFLSNNRNGVRNGSGRELVWKRRQMGRVKEAGE